MDSYLAGSIAPILGALMIWAKARKFSGASAAIFAFTWFRRSSRWSAAPPPRCFCTRTARQRPSIGLVFLGSCVVARKPVAFYLAQRYGTDGTHEGMSIFDKMWDNYRRVPPSDVRHQLSLGCFVPRPGRPRPRSSSVTIRYGTAYNYDQILPFAATALGIVGSIAIGRYFTKRGRARAALAGAAGSEPARSLDDRRRATFAGCQNGHLARREGGGRTLLTEPSATPLDLVAGDDRHQRPGPQ